MDIKWEQEWDKIYKTQGEVQIDVLPTVRVATDVFKKYGCKSIMDLGCGTGRHSIYLAQQGFKVYATDVSDTGLEITKLKAEKLNLDNIKFKKHDMRDITFETNSFDGVLCVWTTGHGSLDDSRRNVSEIYRVLKPNGVVVIDYVSKDDGNYGKGKEIEKDTFIDNVEGEENIPHHYTTIDELKELYSNFSEVNIASKDYYFWDVFKRKHTIKAFVVISIK
ncbi:class I SAM-dependent methyltransferase [Clostridium estertheticum]|uniref:class I SAM-dependent methyltransferase n=1 Tax=Clostridium estertheticum TaxID=238834 RepID=UPI001C0B09CF|nr:class I SAM-dependent methyltransferase [Clostridium estertheticum]MBU3186332.1 class I SAM-dependent methyltransferase [Clostridium estertheticum]MCB2340554.1 class I SAM-dependent methyltransferase [Clostridium estertheticum]